MARKEHAKVMGVAMNIDVFNRLIAVLIPAILAGFLAWQDVDTQDIIAIVSVVGAGSINYISSKSAEKRSKQQ